MRFRVVVFDFDGTLVDSNALKREAFDQVFADHPACLRALPHTIALLAHQSRDEIIRAVVDHVAGLTPAEREAEAVRRTAAYTTLVERGIVERAQGSPAGRLLRRWHGRAALYVCSHTPRAALGQVLQRLGWRSYFEGVEGYPVRKADMLRATLARHGVRGDQVLMVGDGDGDEAAATEAGTAFFRVARLPDLARLDRLLVA